MDDKAPWIVWFLSVCDFGVVLFAIYLLCRNNELGTQNERLRNENAGLKLSNQYAQPEQTQHEWTPLEEQIGL